MSDRNRGLTQSQLVFRATIWREKLITQIEHKADFSRVPPLEVTPLTHTLLCFDSWEALSLYCDLKKISNNFPFGTISWSFHRTGLPNRVGKEEAIPGSNETGWVRSSDLTGVIQLVDNQRGEEVTLLVLPNSCLFKLREKKQVRNKNKLRWSVALGPVQLRGHSLLLTSLMVGVPRPMARTPCPKQFTP